MLNANPELKSLILSVYTNNFIQNIIQEMNINVRSQFSEYKMITNLSIKKNTKFPFFFIFLIFKIFFFFFFNFQDFF